MKCQLKPLRRDDYPVTFTDEQWSRLAAGLPRRRLRLQPSPASRQRGAIPWLTYQDKRGRVIYGGKPLGKPPKSRRLKRRAGR